MSRAGQGQADDARDDSGNGGHPAPSVRQGELPVRERRTAARVSGAQLLRAQPDACRHAAPRRDVGGESGDRALPGSEEAPRRGGERRTGTAGFPARPGLRDRTRGKREGPRRTPLHQADLVFLPGTPRSGRRDSNPRPSPWQGDQVQLILIRAPHSTSSLQVWPGAGSLSLSALPGVCVR